MSAPIPTKEPRKVTIGDTWTWKKSFPDFPASDGWTLTYALINSSNSITITASADGDDYLVEEAIATTGAYTAGTYNWQSYVIYDGERFKVGSGVMEVEANFAAGAAEVRSNAKKILDALDAALLGKASKDQLSYTINNRSISRYSPAELTEWRAAYYQMYKRELRQEHGQGNKRVIKVRFK